MQNTSNTNHTILNAGVETVLADVNNEPESLARLSDDLAVSKREKKMIDKVLDMARPTSKSLMYEGETRKSPITARPKWPKSSPETSTSTRNLLQQQH